MKNVTPSYKSDGDHSQCPFCRAVTCDHFFGYDDQDQPVYAVGHDMKTGQPTEFRLPNQGVYRMYGEIIERGITLVPADQVNLSLSPV